MKIILSLIAILTFTWTYMFFQQSENEENKISIYQKYVQWKSKYGKNTNGAEDEYRFQVFQSNFEAIEERNQRNKNVKFGLNKFSDITPEEFRATKFGINPISPSKYTKNPQSNSEIIANFPNYVNWAEKGAVSPVVPDQGKCGSCWAFSTAGALEGLYSINSGQFTYFSEQQLVSCAPYPDFQGCRGSSNHEAPFAFEYTAEKGIQSLTDYPYTSGKSGKNGKCMYDKSEVVFQNQGNKTIQEPSNNEIFETVSGQPGSVLVFADFWQSYESGVMPFSECEGPFLDHAVLLVGYKITDTEIPYFLVRNSWGPDWGENGYIKLEITDDERGTCGIKSIISVPTL